MLRCVAFITLCFLLPLLTQCATKKITVLPETQVPYWHESLLFQRGYKDGKEDNAKGRSNSYTRYSERYYNAKTEAEYARGYKTGYTE